MEVRFQRANHRTGNESVVLKFDGVVDDLTACVLVDSGHGVDLSTLLEDDEYLAAVLVTHAHLDHFRSLGQNVDDGAPVLAATPTANVLETALRENDRNDRLVGDTDAALDALEGVSGWRTILGDDAVRVHPVSAGHAPGAAGFVVQFRDGDVARNVLVTGDFTTTTAGGYPSLPLELPVDVEAMLVNVSTTDDFEAAFTEAVETTLARATEGTTTLATAGGLLGVHLARVLTAATDRFDLDVPVRLVGQPAKLYAGLELPADDVDLQPEYADPSAMLDAGTVTIAAPETPVDGSAKRLFEAIADDANAALVQVTSGALDVTSAASCTTYAFEVRPHPTESVVDRVVESYDPLHVVVAHETGPSLDAYKDKYAAFVWANQDAIEQTLFADGDWRAPPWVSERAERYVYGNTAEFGGNAIPEGANAFDVALPPVEPGAVELHEEGVDVSRLESRFGRDATSDAAGGATAGGATAGGATVRSDAVGAAGVSLADVVARLDDIEGLLADATIERYGGRREVPVSVRRVDDATVLVLPSDVDVEDADDITVLVDDEDEE